MKIKAATIQFSPVLGNVEQNISIIKKLMTQVNSDVSLVVLPELASTGYNFGSRDEAMLCAEQVSRSEYLSFLLSEASKRNCFIVSGFNERDKDELFNSSVLMSPSGLVGIYRKLHLFRNEKTIFSQGNIGLPVFQTEIGRIGMLVCFDWMFPEVWRVLSMKKCQVVCHPANLVLPYCQSVVPSYALLNRYFILTCNRIGIEGEFQFTGKSVICSPDGKVLKLGHGNLTQVLEAELDLSLTGNYQITPENHLINDRRTDVYGNLNL